jgi:hydroxymethylpyrimidine/phosphomethylpyrimidine kinase
MKQVLTIAGSDSGAGAGIQADLKTFAAHNVYGTSAITAITAQNTTGVIDYFVVPHKMVKLQIEAILNDFDIKAIKTGMLPNVKIIETIANILKNKNINLIVDTVISAKGGKNLIEEDTSFALQNYLFPIATIITPNIPEAEILTELKITTVKKMEIAAKKLFETGTKYVLIKGGHLNGKKSIDILFDGINYHYFENERICSKNTHGTGCTLASAIAANLALGLNIYDAIDSANSYVNKCIKTSVTLNIGNGHGPMNHFCKI